MNQLLTSLKSSWARYGFGLAITGVVTILHFIISPYINRDAFDLFQGAVFLSAWYGGLRPAILTSIVSIIALDYFFMAPINAFALGVTDVIRLGIFAAVAFLTSSLSARLKQANLNLEN